MNITSKRISKTIIAFTTLELLTNARDSFNDIVWDMRPRSVDETADAHSDLRAQLAAINDISTALVLGDADMIRKEFKDGGTMFMVGKAMETIEKLNLKKKPFELHITDHLNRVHIIEDTSVEY